MTMIPLRFTLTFALLLGSLALPAQAAGHLAYKRPYNLAPSADLVYAIKATHSGIPISGEALFKWQAGQGKYSVVAETRAMLLGKVLETRSEGGIDEFGLAPVSFVENRLRKPPTTTRFDRAAKSISFADSIHTYPIKGGEQDRTSIIWQLVSVARATPAKFITGSEWDFFVAGPHDADPWTFKVLEKTATRTPLGNLATLRIVRKPPPDAKAQSVELWLAPGLEWYPVRVRFADEDGNVIEQFLEKVSKK